MRGDDLSLYNIHCCIYSSCLSSLLGVIERAEKTELSKIKLPRINLPLHTRIRLRTVKNRVISLAHPIAVRNSRAALAKIYRTMTDMRTAELAGTTDLDNRIPRIFHFVYGFKGPEDFPFYAYVAIKTALQHNPGFRAVFHYCHEPYGRWWEAAKSLVVPHRISDFEYFRTAHLYHYAHKSDVVRLIALSTIGGIYLDIDTITLAPFDRLLSEQFVMGVQPSSPMCRGGLCNAVMLSQPGSAFVERWISEYTHFRSKGRDKYWDFHSVRLPAYIYRNTDMPITVEDHSTFFPMLWNEVGKYVFRPAGDKYRGMFSNTLCIHLWNGFNEQKLNSIDPEYVATSSSLYASFARLDNITWP